MPAPVERGRSPEIKSEAITQSQINWVQAAIRLKSYHSGNRVWNLPQDALNPNGSINPQKALLDSASHPASEFHTVLQELQQNDPEMVDGFSPVLAKAVLERINDRIWSHRVFSQREIEEATRDEQSFKEITLARMQRDPKNFQEVVAKFAPILPIEGIEAVLTILKQKVDTIELFETFGAVFSHHFDKTGLKDLVVDYSTSPRIAPKLFNHFNEPGVIDLFSPDDQQQLVHNMLQFPVFVYKPQALKEYLKRELISPEQIPDIIIQSIEGNKYTAPSVEKFLEFFPEGSAERESLKNTVKNAYLTKEKGGPTIRSLQDIQESGLFSDTELTDIVRLIAQNRPGNFYLELEDASKYLPAEDMRELVLQSFRVRDFTAFVAPATLQVVFGGETFSASDREEILNAYILLQPERILNNLNTLSDLVGSQESSKIINAVLERAEPQNILPEVHNWIDHIPEAERKDRLLKLIRRDQWLKFVELYAEPSSPDKENILQKYISKDEILAVVIQNIEENSHGVLFELKAIKDIAPDIDWFKKLIEDIRIKHPDAFASQFGAIPDYLTMYDAEKITGMIGEALNSKPTHAVNWLGSINSWGSDVKPEFTWEFLQKIKEYTGGRMLAAIPDWASHVPDAQREQFMLDLSKINPGHAIDNFIPFSFHTGISEDQIIANALADQERLSYAPRNLKNLFAELKHQNFAVSFRAREEIISIYEQIAQIRRDSFLTDIHNKATKNSPPLPNKEAKIAEKEILATVAFLGTLKDKDAAAFERVKDEINLTETSLTRDSLQLLLFKEISHIMNINPEMITPEGIGKFNESMGSLYPFMTYFFDQQSSKPHVDLLKGMFEGILTGNYLEWKFSLKDSDTNKKTLDELKELGLLPANLDRDDYARWQLEESTNYEETLTVKADDVSRKVKEVLQNNAEHLPNDFFNAAEFFKDETKILGHELNQAKRYMGMIRRVDGEANETYQKAKQETDRLLEQMEKVKLHALLRRFLTLSPEEVSTNRLNNVDKKKYRTLKDALRDIRNIFTDDDAIVLDQVESLIDSYSQSEGMQSITVSDTANPGVLMEIGQRPVPTCQHYENGEYRQALLAYLSEPNTKALVVRNGSNNIIARAMARIVEDPDGKTALHVDRIYSSVASKDIDRLIISHAAKKATAIKAQLYTSISIEQQADEETSRKLGTTLEVKRIRAPHAYVDAAGGLVTRLDSNGYKISDTVKAN